MKTISKRLSLVLAALAFLAQAPPPAPPAKTSLAVYPIKAVGAVDKSLAATLTSLLTNELTKSPSLIVIKRAGGQSFTLHFTYLNKIPGGGQSRMPVPPIQFFLLKHLIQI